MKTLKQYFSLRGLLAKGLRTINDKKEKAIFREVMSYIIAAENGSYIEGTKWKKDSAQNRFILGKKFMSFEFVAGEIACGRNTPIKLTTSTQTTKSL